MTTETQNLIYTLECPHCHEEVKYEMTPAEHKVDAGTLASNDGAMLFSHGTHNPCGGKVTLHRALSIYGKVTLALQAEYSFLTDYEKLVYPDGFEPPK